MTMFSALQSLAAGKSEAELEQLADDLHTRVGGRLGAYRFAKKALGAAVLPFRRRPFKLNTTYRGDRIEGRASPFDPSTTRRQ